MFLRFYATFPLRIKVNMQSNSPIYIFTVILECLLSNENKIPVIKTILFNYPKTKCVCKIEQYVMQPTICDLLSPTMHNRFSQKFCKEFEKKMQIQIAIFWQDTYFLFGVSAKHLRDDVSTTVSQNDTTGSATLISENSKKLWNEKF